MVIHQSVIMLKSLMMQKSLVMQKSTAIQRSGPLTVRGNAVIKSNYDYFVLKRNWWSDERYFTWTSSNNMWSVGCFYGTGEELIKKAYADSEEKGRDYEIVVKYVELINKNYKNEKVHC